MHDPYGLYDAAPNPTWMTHVNAESVGTALKHLLEIAAGKVYWLGVDDDDPILEVLKLASTLASIVTDNTPVDGQLPVPVRVAVLAARRIDHGAEDFEDELLVNPFSGNHIKGARSVITNMRHTVGDLRNAAGAL